jgi:hypothetical protein
VDRITFYSAIVRSLAPLRAELAGQMPADDVPRIDESTVHKEALSTPRWILMLVSEGRRGSDWMFPFGVL